MISSGCVRLRDGDIVISSACVRLRDGDIVMRYLVVVSD